MRNPIRTRWGKDVAHKLIEREMQVNQFGKSIGVRPAVLSQLMHGRYAGKDFNAVVDKVNKELDIEGKPPKLSLEWLESVKIAMIQTTDSEVYTIKVNELAKSIGFSKDRVSLVINGNAIDRPVIEAINKELNIKCSALADE